MGGLFGGGGGGSYTPPPVPPAPAPAPAPTVDAAKQAAQQTQANAGRQGSAAAVLTSQVGDMTSPRTGEKKLLGE